MQVSYLSCCDGGCNKSNYEKWTLIIHRNRSLHAASWLNKQTVVYNESKQTGHLYTALSLRCSGTACANHDPRLIFKARLVFKARPLLAQLCQTPGLYSRPGLYLRPGFYSRKYGSLWKTKESTSHFHHSPVRAYWQNLALLRILKHSNWLWIKL